MQAIIDKVKREPALLLGLLGAGFALAAAFGFDLSKEQTGAITGFVVVLLSIITRQSVTPNVSVAAEELHGGANGVPDHVLVAGEAADVITGAPVEVIPATDERAYDEGEPEPHVAT